MTLSRLCSMQLSRATWRCSQRFSAGALRGLTRGSLSQEVKPLVTPAASATSRPICWTRVAGRSAAVPTQLAAGSSRRLAQTSPSSAHVLQSFWSRSNSVRDFDYGVSSPSWSSASLKRRAEPALVDRDKSRFYSPASLLEGPLPREGVAGIARFQLWKKNGFLCVKATSMDFTLALPVFVSDRRGYPSLSAILEAWKDCAFANRRWAALREYLSTAASRGEAGCPNEHWGDVSHGKVITFKHGGEPLDMRWEVPPTCGKFWFFTVQR